MKRGLFIVLEGCDRAGKSTQAKRLAQHMTTAHEQVELLRFPDRTTIIGKMIDAYLTNSQEFDDHAVHLLFSANRWELKEKIIRLISKGTHVIADRYIYSGVAFSAAKGLDVQWCRQPDYGLPAPDVVLFLDLPVEDAAQRGAFGEERYENMEFQRKVYDIFCKIRDPTWQIIDARQSPSEIEKQIANCITNFPRGENLPPLGYLPVNN